MIIFFRPSTQLLWWTLVPSYTWTGSFRRQSRTICVLFSSNLTTPLPNPTYASCGISWNGRGSGRSREETLKLRRLLSYFFAELKDRSRIERTLSDRFWDRWLKEIWSLVCLRFDGKHLHYTSVHLAAQTTKTESNGSFTTNVTQLLLK